MGGSKFPPRQSLTEAIWHQRSTKNDEWIRETVTASKADGVRRKGKIEAEAAGVACCGNMPCARVPSLIGRKLYKVSADQNDQNRLANHAKKHVR